MAQNSYSHSLLHLLGNFYPCLLSIAYHKVREYLIVEIDMKKMATKFFAFKTHLKINFNLTKADWMQF